MILRNRGMLTDAMISYLDSRRREEPELVLGKEDVQERTLPEDQYSVEVRIRDNYEKGRPYSADVSVRIGEDMLYVRSFDLNFRNPKRRVVRRLVMRELRTDERKELAEDWLTIDCKVDRSQSWRSLV